jgi:hypothetical protein
MYRVSTATHMRELLFIIFSRGDILWKNQSLNFSPSADRWTRRSGRWSYCHASSALCRVIRANYFFHSISLAILDIGFQKVLF